VSFFYKCSQSLALKKKPRKCENSAIQRDRPAMERFECNGILRITICPTIAKITISHRFAHPYPVDNNISDDVKTFIQSNSNLLPKDIYSQLIQQNLSTTIRQKQIHFWWSKYMQEKFKRHECAFTSSGLWLQEQEQKIIFQISTPVHAIAFSTGFTKMLQKHGYNIIECGIDATCTYLFVTFA
jgi:hypothetical protein